MKLVKRRITQFSSLCLRLIPHRIRKKITVHLSDLFFLLIIHSQPQLPHDLPPELATFTCGRHSIFFCSSSRVFLRYSTDQWIANSVKTHLNSSFPLAHPSRIYFLMTRTIHNWYCQGRCSGISFNYYVAVNSHINLFSFFPSSYIIFQFNSSLTFVLLQSGYNQFFFLRS